MNAIYKLLKINRMIKGHRVKYAALLASDLLGIRHLSVRIDPIFACNLRCRMCYFSDSEWRKQHQGRMDIADFERIAAMLFPKALQLVIGCAAEPTLHPDLLSMMRIGKKYRVPYISIVSNGQLLTEEHIREFITGGLDELMISTHGITKKTYEHMMTNARFDKLAEVLETLASLKREYNSQLPKLRINYTVNPDNLEELAQFFEVYGKFDIQVLQIRPIMDLGNTDYREKDLSPHLAKYNTTIRNLADQCRKNQIIFLANTADPTYQVANPASCISHEVLRHVSPQLVWRPDFNWKEESYKEYCKRTGWRRHLLRMMFCNNADTSDANVNRQRMTYDVNM